MPFGMAARRPGTLNGQPGKGSKELPFPFPLLSNGSMDAPVRS